MVGSYGIDFTHGINEKKKNLWYNSVQVTEMLYTHGHSQLDHTRLLCLLLPSRFHSGVWGTIPGFHES